MVDTDDMDIHDYPVGDVEMTEASFSFSYHLEDEFARFLPEVRHQVGASCVYNAISTLIEIKLRQKYGNWKSISTKHMMDVHKSPCTDLDGFLDWLQTEGVAYESTYTSPDNTGEVVRINGFRMLDASDSNAILSEIMENGPVGLSLIEYKELSELKAGEMYIGQRSSFVHSKPSSLHHLVCGIGGGFNSVEGSFHYFFNSWGDWNGSKGFGKTSGDLGLVSYAFAIDI